MVLLIPSPIIIGVINYSQLLYVTVFRISDYIFIHNVSYFKFPKTHDISFQQSTIP